MRFHFFTNRVLNIWNGLPEETVGAKTLNIFKSKLDAWLVKKEVTAIVHYSSARVFFRVAVQLTTRLLSSLQNMNNSYKKFFVHI